MLRRITLKVRIIRRSEYVDWKAECVWLCVHVTNQKQKRKKNRSKSKIREDSSNGTRKSAKTMKGSVGHNFWIGAKITANGVK